MDTLAFPTDWIERYAARSVRPPDYSAAAVAERVKAFLEANNLNPDVTFGIVVKPGEGTPYRPAKGWQKAGEEAKRVTASHQMVGINLGRGLCAVDVDHPEETRTLTPDWLMEQGGRVVLTPSGRGTTLHAYFLLPKDAPRSKKYPWGEFLTEGMHTVAEGSFRPSYAGKPQGIYLLISDPEAPLVELPRKVMDSMGFPPPRTEAPKESGEEAVEISPPRPGASPIPQPKEKIKEGKRHDYLAKALGKLTWAPGATPSWVRDEMREIYRTHLDHGGKEPYTKGELERLLEDVEEMMSAPNREAYLKKVKGGAYTEAASGEGGGAPNGLKKQWAFDAPGLFAALRGRMRIAYDGSRFYIYEGGVYTPGAWVEEDIRCALEDIVTERGLMYRVEDGDKIIKYAKQRAPRIDLLSEEPVKYRGFRNGDLRVADMVLVPHDPERLMVTQLAVDYRPDPQQFIPDAGPLGKWIEERMELADFDFITTVLGAAILGDALPRTATMLIGQVGGEGKTTFLRVMEKALGRDAHSTLTPHELASPSRNKYALAELVGKVANIGGDVGSGELQDVGLWKMMTGRDTLRSDVKYRNPIRFLSRAVHFFAGQAAPRTKDISEAYYDRLTLIQMRPPIPKEERVEDYLESITSDSDLSWLLSYAVAAAVRRRDYGMPRLSMESMELKEHYRGEADYITLFVETHLAFAEDRRTRRSTLTYEAQQFIRKAGGGTQTLQNIAAMLRKAIPEAAGEVEVKETRIGRGHVWDGVAYLKDGRHEGLLATEAELRDIGVRRVK